MMKSEIIKKICMSWFVLIGHTWYESASANTTKEKHKILKVFSSQGHQGQSMSAATEAPSQRTIITCLQLVRFLSSELGMLVAIFLSEE